MEPFPDLPQRTLHFHTLGMPDHIFFEDDQDDEDEEDDDQDEDNEGEEVEDDDDGEDVKDLNMARFTLNNHPLMFGKAVDIHPVLHPILSITFL